MAQHVRRESNGYTRFVLALSLSTVTAIAVAAPLAVRAINADDPTVSYASSPDDGVDGAVGGADALSSTEDRSLGGDGDAKGGIEAGLVKAQDQTSKSATTDTEPSEETTTSLEAETTTTSAPTTATTPAPTTAPPSSPTSQTTPTSAGTTETSATPSAPPTSPTSSSTTSSSVATPDTQTSVSE